MTNNVQTNEEPEALELLSELNDTEVNPYASLRASKRYEVQMRTHISPANASDSIGETREAVSVDISDGGCQLLTSFPVICGDFFFLSFNYGGVQSPPSLARCLRCRFVQDRAFEVGFRFEHPIDCTKMFQNG